MSESGKETGLSCEAHKSSLMVLCAIRDMHLWSRNMLKDIDFAIEANRAALLLSNTGGTGNG